MRRAGWIVGFAGVVALALASWSAAPLMTRGLRVAGSNYWIDGGLAIKRRAADARHPAVLLLGGSSVHVGLSARRLDQAYGLPAVNVGQHAGLGRAYILDYGAALVRPGDVVVLSLEYSLWGRETSSSTRNLYVLAHDPGYLLRRSPLDGLALLASVPPDDWFRLYVAYRHPDVWPPVAGYQPASIDAWGDETATDHPAPGHAELPALSDPVGQYALDEQAVADVIAFVRRVERAGGRVVIAFPGILRRHLAVDVNAGFLAHLTARLSDAGVRLIDRPEEAVFDAPCLYDYAYHPLRPCAVARTDRLAAALQAAAVRPF